MPYAWLAVAAIAMCLLGRKTYQLTAMGSARWANRSDVSHMLEGTGLIIGNIAGKPNRLGALLALRDSAFLTMRRSSGSSMRGGGGSQNAGSG